MKTTIKKHVTKSLYFEVKIRIDDECKNGHDTISITASIYQKTRYKSYENAPEYIQMDCKEIDGKVYEMIGGGCCHNEIEKYFPQLKPFINLHLSDGEGVPMYAFENGLYHFKEDKLKGANYIRTTLDKVKHIDTSNSSKCVLDFAKVVESLRPQWLKEANECKKLLTKLIKENN